MLEALVEQVIPVHAGFDAIVNDHGGEVVHRVLVIPVHIVLSALSINFAVSLDSVFRHRAIAAFVAYHSGLLLVEGVVSRRLDHAPVK